MNKTGKTVAVLGAALVVIVAIAAAVVLGQLGRLIKRGVESAGPAMTGTAVTLDGARVSIFSGEGALDDLRIGNAKGFLEGYAFDLDRIAISLEPKSLAGDVVRIRSVEVEGPKLIAEFDAAGNNNLKSILDHVKAVAAAPEKAPAGTGTQRKMIIERFRLDGAQVRVVSAAFQLDKALDLPPIELENLGGKQGGAAAADIANQILRPVVDAAIRAARDEYLAAQRGKLEDKAKEKSQELLDKIFD